MEREWEGEEDRVRETDRRENRDKPNNMRQIKRDRERQIQKAKMRLTKPTARRTARPPIQEADAPMNGKKIRQTERNPDVTPKASAIRGAVPLPSRRSRP